MSQEQKLSPEILKPTPDLHLHDGRGVFIRMGTGADQRLVNEYLKHDPDNMTGGLVFAFAEIEDPAEKTGRRRLYLDEVETMVYGDFVRVAGAVAEKNHLSAGSK